MKSVILLLGLWWVHQASGATHSLKYIYTASSEVPSFPQFVVAGLVDEVQFFHYDSDSHQAVAKQDWLNKLAEDNPQYFQRLTQDLQGTHQAFRVNIDIAKKRFNQTRGVHTLMQMLGCQWNDETGAVDAFDYWGYDGEDFVSLDLKNMRFIATTQESVVTKHKWDNNQALLASQKQYYTQICPQWLKKYVQYGRSTLERKVAPEVNLLQKDSEVVCHSTGFYPDGIMITWKRDGEEIQENVTVGETLPNEDGTFQKRAVLTVSPEQRKKGQYTCEVDHKSGPTTVKTLIVEDGNSLGIIIGCVVAAVIVIGVIVAIVVMMKKKDYKKAEQSDSDSDASNVARA